MNLAKNRLTQFVMKTSKLCNLRCKYCYEFEELGKNSRMSLEQLKIAYKYIADYYEALDKQDNLNTEIRFIWHGGEPLLIEPSYYWQTFEDQKAIFDGKFEILNMVQTNLTVLGEERIELLKYGFDKVGVSIDIIGGLRVNIAGHDLQSKVLQNMDILNQAGVNFGCITVLTKNNIDKVTKIFNFFKKSQTQFSFLPLFHGAYEDQHQNFELSTQDILKAYQQLVDAWLQSEDFVSVLPIVDHIHRVLNYILKNSPPTYFNKRLWNTTLLVNTNGDCYSYGDPYGEEEWTLGNIFTTSLNQILSGDRWEKSVLAAEERIAYNCLNCKYFGSCDGYAIAEDHSNCREVSTNGIRVCTLEKSLFEYIENRLKEVNLIDKDGSLKLTSKQAEKLGMNTKQIF
ncbi:radical SAM protein [Microcystis flos-aquae FACHB-1344]|jgi:uncharacterized protein|uniref:Radical SAM protein n=1 Tax=Microcystis flos-aquae FACHB-1344 TaxID=2692899 RepID=A0ABR8HUX0_9CHRO|nr:MULTISPECIES: radical SAM protein [Microcystis]MBD2623161.1 radical SAM protein [Microcystis flos-aquae FACHB-1344]MCA2700468.1 radical SAM protein [Microcystis sp. M179S2]